MVKISLACAIVVPVAPTHKLQTWSDGGCSLGMQWLQHARLDLTNTLVLLVDYGLKTRCATGLSASLPNCLAKGLELDTWLLKINHPRAAPLAMLPTPPRIEVNARSTKKHDIETINNITGENFCCQETICRHGQDDERFFVSGECHHHR